MVGVGCGSQDESSMVSPEFEIKPNAGIKLILSSDWEELVISIGMGSCWGESANPVLYILRHKKGISFGATRKQAEGSDAVRMKIDKSKKFQEELYHYMNYFSKHGTCTPNFWGVHKIEVRKNGEKEYQTIFYGYSAPYNTSGDNKNDEYEKWLREILPTIRTLPFERH